MGTYNRACVTCRLGGNPRTPPSASRPPSVHWHVRETNIVTRHGSSSIAEQPSRRREQTRLGDRRHKWTRSCRNPAGCIWATVGPLRKQTVCPNSSDFRHRSSTPRTYRIRNSHRSSPRPASSRWLTSRRFPASETLNECGLSGTGARRGNGVERPSASAIPLLSVIWEAEAFPDSNDGQWLVVDRHARATEVEMGALFYSPCFAIWRSRSFKILTADAIGRCA